MNFCLYSYSCIFVLFFLSIFKDYVSCVICVDIRKLLFCWYEGYNYVFGVKGICWFIVRGGSVGGGGGLDNLNLFILMKKMEMEGV